MFASVGLSILILGVTLNEAFQAEFRTKPYLFYLARFLVITGAIMCAMSLCIFLYRNAP